MFGPTSDKNDFSLLVDTRAINNNTPTNPNCQLFKFNHEQLDDEQSNNIIEEAHNTSDDEGDRPDHDLHPPQKCLLLLQHDR